MRRFDQRISQIAKPPLVVGELELRGPQPNAGRRFGAKPVVHAVADKILAGAAEIAAAAAAKRHACQQQYQNR